MEVGASVGQSERSETGLYVEPAVPTNISVSVASPGNEVLTRHWSNDEAPLNMYLLVAKTEMKPPMLIISFRFVESELFMGGR